MKINRNQLLDVLNENRTTHKANSEKAFEGYRVQVIKQLEEILENARNKKPFSTNVFLQVVVPQDHTNDYDAVISMLEMSVDHTIEISLDDFRRYALDEWEWKMSWSATNARYTRS